MSRRIYIGPTNLATPDVQISRSGYTAFGDDINNRRMISFAMMRARPPRLSWAGIIPSVNAGWSPFGNINTPPVPAYVLSGQVYSQYSIHIDGNSGRYQEGTPFVVVHINGGLQAVNAYQFAWGIPGGAGYNYLGFSP